MPDARPSVLVVDDDRATLEVYKIALDVHGFEVLAAHDGAAAMEIVEVRIPDAVVLDLSMPRQGGISVIQSLRGRSRTKGIPIIAVSGTKPKEEPFAPGWGWDVFLPKPPDLEVLATELRRLIAAAR